MSQPIQSQARKSSIFSHGNIDTAGHDSMSGRHGGNRGNRGGGSMNGCAQSVELMNLGKTGLWCQIRRVDMPREPIGDFLIVFFAVLWVWWFLFV